MALVRYARSTHSINELRDQLRNSAVVAAPTETAYGLLADATSERAVRAVVRLKGRSDKKPIALIAADLKMVRRYFRLTSGELRLAKKFWPGPLTLLLKPKRKFPRVIVGPGGYVGVRIPASAWLRKLITAYGKPLTATSANRAGGLTPYSATAVVRQLKPRGLKYLVDGGTLQRRSTSTVALVVGHRLTVLREGAIPRVKLKRVLG